MEIFGELLAPIIESPAFQRASDILGVVLFVAAVAMVFWLFRDARRRDSVPFLWGLLGAVALIIGAFIGFGQSAWGFTAVGGATLALVLVVLFAYTLLRPAEFAADANERELSQRLLEAELETNACPSCGGGIEVDYLICPNCNVTLRSPCDYCGRPIKPTWNICPYCRSAKGQSEPSVPASSPKPASTSSTRDTGRDAGTSSSSGAGDSSSVRLRRKTSSDSGSASAAGSTPRRSRSAPKPVDDDDDLELNFDSPKTGNVKRSSTGSRTSTGTKPSSSSSTFKD